MISFSSIFFLPRLMVDFIISLFALALEKEEEIFMEVEYGKAVAS